MSEPGVQYVVASAHLDTQCEWTIQDSIRENIPWTVRENFKLFEKYPSYKFSWEGASRYMLLKEYYPELYEQLKGYIKGERWFVAGSMIENVDVNVPSPEALIRQVLYGNGFFQHEFGKKSRDLMMSDTFGFSFGLPSIAAHCGLLGFSSGKMGVGSAIYPPFDVGTWIGPDGRSVIAVLKPGAAAGIINSDLSKDPGTIDKVEKQGHYSGVYVGYSYFGSSNSGGTPTEDSVRWMEASVQNPGGSLKVVSASSDQMFREMTQERRTNLQHYQGELLLTTHGVGTYTAQAPMKRWNRKNELLATSAEAAAVGAMWLGAAPYPQARLTENWVRFLWHQAHDDITGLSVPAAYIFSWNDELLAMQQFAGVLQDSTGAVTRGLDTSGDGVPIVVYNPLGMPREDVVQGEVEFPQPAPATLKAIGPDGKETPVQIVSRPISVDQSGADPKSETKKASPAPVRLSVLFSANVPAVGYAVYRLAPGAKPDDKATANIATKISKEDRQLENEHYLVKLDANGDIASIKDKQLDKEILSKPIQLQLLENPSPDRPIQRIYYDTVNADPRSRVRGPVEIQIIEDGPVRVGFEVRRYSPYATYVQQIRLPAGPAGVRVEIETHIAWNEKGTLLKMAFPLTAANEKATYDIGLGTIERPNNTTHLYEVPAQQWADITNADGAFGTALVTDCKYGWDKPSDNVLRSTLIHTPAAFRSAPHQAFSDIGRHKMLHAICPHEGDWRTGDIPWKAACVNQPLVAFQAASHRGVLGKTFSIASVNTKQVAIRALKKAEDSNEIVIRLQELYGRDAADVEVLFPAKVLSARELNGQEESANEIPVTKENRLLTKLGVYQPRTFAVTLVAPESRLEMPVSQTIKLPWNVQTTTAVGKRLPDAIEDNGASIPAEIFPQKLEFEGINYTFGPANGSNAVRCAGQEIGISPAKIPRHLHLLLAAGSAFSGGKFTVGDRSKILGVPSLIGKIGQPDYQPVTKSGRPKGTGEKAFLRMEPVAWIGTHRHDKDGKDEPYQFCHFYYQTLEVPSGAKVLKLPKNEQLFVFSAAIADRDNTEIRPMSPLTDTIEYLTDPHSGDLSQ